MCTHTAVQRLRSGWSRSVRLSWAAASAGSPESWPAVRSVKRASPVSAAARGPWPATSPITIIQPPGVGNAS